MSQVKILPRQSLVERHTSLSYLARSNAMMWPARKAPPGMVVSKASRVAMVMVPFVVSSMPNGMVKAIGMRTIL